MILQTGAHRSGQDNFMQDYSHILLAVDFAASTAQVAERALDMAKRHNARLSLIHVVEFVPMDLSSELVLPQDIELDRELVERARNRLQELATQLGIPDAVQRVLPGSTRHEILRYAGEEQVDLIVIGSHGRHGIQLLLGSTANAILHRATCDVLAVRIRE
jgi:universal stress protein A